MGASKRYSPINFDVTPGNTEPRDGWEVVTSYQGEREDLGLVDLSHWSKWQLQARNLSELRLDGLQIPQVSGQVWIGDGMLAGRLGPKQAMVLHFKEQAPARPKMPALTEITDAFALVGLYGPACASVMEKISSLDLTRPDQKAPYLLQGPVLGVPAKVIAIAPASGLQAFLVACARGYGQDLVAALLDAGEEFGLRPAGEDAFLNGIRVD